MKKTILALALAAGLTSFAGSAKANINWNWSLTDSSTSEYIGSGQFTTGADLGGGSYHVSSISGTYENVTIGGLLNEWSYYNDNIYFSYPSAPVNGNGISFFTLSPFKNHGGDGGGTFENIWNGHGSVVGLYNNTQYVMSGANFNVSADTAAVPEPSQVAASLLLAAGIAGFVIVKRRKETSALEALAA